MDKNLEQASFFRKMFLYSLLGVLVGFLLLLTRVANELFFLSLAIAIIAFILWIAALIANQAALKGRNWSSFFVLSIFFPFIMWIVVSVMTTDQSQPISGTKKCPKCAEYVKAEATLCKHCGSAIRPQK
jgi:hypothetical protein